MDIEICNEMSEKIALLSGMERCKEEAKQGIKLQTLNLIIDCEKCDVDKKKIREAFFREIFGGNETLFEIYFSKLGDDEIKMKVEEICDFKKKVLEINEKTKFKIVRYAIHPESFCKAYLGEFYMEYSSVSVVKIWYHQQIQ